MANTAVCEIIDACIGRAIDVVSARHAAELQHGGPPYASDRSSGRSSRGRGGGRSRSRGRGRGRSGEDAGAAITESNAVPTTETAEASTAVVGESTTTNTSDAGNSDNTNNTDTSRRGVGNTANIGTTTNTGGRGRPTRARSTSTSTSSGRSRGRSRGRTGTHASTGGRDGSRDGTGNTVSLDRAAMIDDTAEPRTALHVALQVAPRRDIADIEYADIDRMLEECPAWVVNIVVYTWMIEHGIPMGDLYNHTANMAIIAAISNPVQVQYRDIRFDLGRASNRDVCCWINVAYLLHVPRLFTLLANLHRLNCRDCGMALIRAALVHQYHTVAAILVQRLLIRDTGLDSCGGRRGDDTAADDTSAVAASRADGVGTGTHTTTNTDRNTITDRNAPDHLASGGETEDVSDVEFDVFIGVNTAGELVIDFVAIRADGDNIGEYGEDVAVTRPPFSLVGHTDTCADICTICYEACTDASPYDGGGSGSGGGSGGGSGSGDMPPARVLATLACRHTFHIQCIRGHYETAVHTPKCPSCRADII